MGLDAAGCLDRGWRRVASGDDMIAVTRFDRSEFVLNAEFIQSVESTPDTHIVLFNGVSFVVRETRDEVVQRVMDYRKAVYGGVGRPLLSLVQD